MICRSQRKIGQAVLANPEFTTTASIHKLAQKQMQAVRPLSVSVNQSDFKVFQN